MNASRRSSRLLLLPLPAVLTALWIGACGSDGGSMFPGAPTDGDGAVVDDATFVDDPTDGSVDLVASLAFEPPTQTLTLDGVTPSTAEYKLRAVLKDGTTAYVTPHALAFDRPDLAAPVNGNPVRLTALGRFAGKGKLHAIYGGAEAEAELAVVVRQRDLNGVSPAIADALDAANLPQDPSLTKLRYPYDATVFPLGLVSPLVMWDAPRSGDVYRLRLEQANYTYDTYATVDGLGQLRIDQAVWDRMTASNTGGANGMRLTLSRYDTSNQRAYSSANEAWTIATQSLRGAIYYWTASQTGEERTGHITRIRPGVGAQPEIMSTGYANKCMGCHAVSADGSTLAASVEDAPSDAPYTNGWQNGRAWASFNLPEGTLRHQSRRHGGNLALTPDGKYTVFGGRAQAGQTSPALGSKNATLGNTATGEIIVDSGLDDLALATPPENQYAGIAMPAFSPDGKKLALVEFFGSLGTTQDNVLPVSRQILVVDFDRAALKFAATPTRLPLASFSPFATKGIGYPTFTPDSAWVAYHVGNESTGCFKDDFGNCDDEVRHRGQLWFQKADGTGVPIHLGQADTPPEMRDRELSVEPTFNPIPRGGYSWAVFTSMRDWGNKLMGQAKNGKRRLWVAALDTVVGTADPSHPPFYLEGQEDSPNMRGFWTLAKCTDSPPPGVDAGTAGACQAGFECCSGFCDRGTCVEPSVIACKPVGDACATTADCCNGGAGVTCQAGTCRIVRPK